MISIIGIDLRGYYCLRRGSGNAPHITHDAGFRYLSIQSRYYPFQGKKQMNNIIKLTFFIILIVTPILVNANQALEEKMNNLDNWASWGGDYQGTRYSKLNQINSKNVHQLKVAWNFPLDAYSGLEGGPLVVDDVIYIVTPFPNNVFAIEQKSKKLLWSYKSNQHEDTVIPRMCCDKVNRGLAFAEGMIFLNQADTTLVALDAKTGKKIWSVKNGNPKTGSTATSAPLVVNDTVIVGISGGEFGVRGHLTAYKLKDGSLLWRGYSVGPDQEMLIDPVKTKSWQIGKMRSVGKDSSLLSWKGDQWKVGGGTTWGWISYDPKLNLIYYGTGNPGTWNPVQRPGDNKWASSLWARDATTGQVRWVYQMTPHDQWDFDGVNESVLIDQLIKGKKRQTLVHFDKNGFAYMLDRASGELLSAEKFDQSVNWATKIDINSGRPQVVEKYSPQFLGEDVNTTGICPTNMGAKSQAPVAYSPRTGLFYIPANHLCMEYEPFEVSYTSGQPYVGATLSNYPAKSDAKTGKKNTKSTHLGQFTAWDVSKNKIKWTINEPFALWSGALATAGDVVFYGTLKGYLVAVDAISGKELYRFKTPSTGIVSNINTWRYQSKQYIGVLTHVGGWAGIEALSEGVISEYSSKALDASKPFYGLGRYRSAKPHRINGETFSVFSLP